MTNELLRFEVAKVAGWDFGLPAGGTDPALREVRFCGGSHCGYVRTGDEITDGMLDVLKIPRFATSKEAAGALIETMGGVGGQIDITNVTPQGEWLCQCVRKDGRTCKGIAKTFERAVCLCFLETVAPAVVAEIVG